MNELLEYMISINQQVAIAGSVGCFFHALIWLTIYAFFKQKRLFLEEGFLCLVYGYGFLFFGVYYVPYGLTLVVAIVYVRGFRTIVTRFTILVVALFPDLLRSLSRKISN